MNIRIYLWYRRVCRGYHCKNCILGLLPKTIFLLLLSFIVCISPAYALTVLSGPDTDGCYEIRVEGEDIIFDVSIFSDLYVSRDNGKSWKVVLRDDRKTINWLNAKGTRVLSKTTFPAGHYNAIRTRSHRIIKVDLEDRVGRPAREVLIDLGEELDFVIEKIDLTLSEGSIIDFRIDNPLVYLDLHVRWDTTINAYADPQIIERVFKKDVTGSAFVIE